MEIEHIHLALRIFLFGKLTACLGPTRHGTRPGTNRTFLFLVVLLSNGIKLENYHFHPIEKHQTAKEVDRPKKKPESLRPGNYQKEFVLTTIFPD